MDLPAVALTFAIPSQVINSLHALILSCPLLLLKRYGPPQQPKYKLQAQGMVLQSEAAHRTIY